MEIDGKRGVDKWLPHQLGHEGSGIVVGIGSKVKYFKKNDEVIISWIKTEGIDAPGGIYEYKDKIINSGSATSFSEYSIVSENRLIKKPLYFNFKEACYFGCAIPTGAGMVLKEKNIRRKKNILVIGLGGVGISTIMCLILKGFNKIDVLETNKKKINKLKKNKYLRDVIFYCSISEVKNSKYDLVFESAGLIKTIEFGFKVLKNDGKLIFASHPEFSKKIKLDPHELIKGKKIIGTWGGLIKSKKEFNIIFELFRKNKNILSLLNSEEYKFKDINIAINKLKKGIQIRPIINF